MKKYAIQVLYIKVLKTLQSNTYRLLYSWLYNTEIYLDKSPDDYHMVQYDKVIWARVHIYFGIVQSTV